MRKALQIYLLTAFCVLSASSLEAAPAAELWAFWQPHEDRSERAFDHSAWQEILDRYVIAGEQQINLFAYSRVSAKDQLLLEAYLQSVTTIDPRSYPLAEQMAYWINLYNALTIQVVLQNAGEESILRMGRGLFSFGPWNDEVAEVAGQALTLNDIEHRILRPIWRDHRIHFAVNCASIGCPNLSATAYTAGNLETQLARAELAYLNHPRGVSLGDNGKLVVSSIFDWYLEDFASDQRQLLDYLAQHHAEYADQLRTYTGRIRYEYDWSLNTTP